MARWLGVFLVVVMSAAPAGAERYAFIVGIGGYDEKHLVPLGEFPRHDAIEFREVLLDGGYRPENVVLMVDDLAALPNQGVAGRYLPEAAKIRRELDLLLPSLERDDSLVVALMGHGVQFRGDKEPYFCPLDARLDDKSTLLPITWLYDRLKYDAKSDIGCKPRQKLVLIDACRNDPESVIRRTGGRGPGLASVTLPQLAPLPEGIVALFSCAEGQQALQHEPLRHGIFFYHVLEGLRGKADGDRDQKVTLDEVIAYTKSQTQTYARVNLAAAQTPRQKGYFDGVWELRSLDAPRELTNSVGMQLRLIDAGEFWMGSTDAQVAAAKRMYAEGNYSNEQPRHLVRLTKDFYLGAHEVTKGQFAEFVRESGYHTEAEKDGKGGWGIPNADTSEQATKYTWRETGIPQPDDHPVVNVSWNDAVAYCEWLSQKEGQTYRLPTEAEWEYACRAGSGGLWSFGDSHKELMDHANVIDMTANELKLVRPDWPAVSRYGRNFTSPVGSFTPNALGLYDMHGNVWEWCADWYSVDYYGKSPALDPVGATAGDMRVQRGGAFFGMEYSRSAFRKGDEPGSRLYSTGFRVARTK